MPLRKIADLPYACRSSDHNPPSMIVLAPGRYEHTCSACGHRTQFTVYPGATSVSQNDYPNTWVHRGPAPEARWGSGSLYPYESNLC